MKEEYKIFFAIPFDSATYNLYEKIRDRIRGNYKDKSFGISITIGNKEVGPSPVICEINTFKAHNRELNDQFKKIIQESDIVIADLTNNNPNVHFELGIALMNDKNIFRVTGRSLTELGFDIRNLEVHKYKDEGDLFDKIIKYLDTFFKIKELPFSDKLGKFYFKKEVPFELIGINNTSFPFASHTEDDYLKMKDGSVKVEFEITKLLEGQVEEIRKNWFGIYFRSALDNLNLSNLLYVRKNGKVEIAQYSGQYSIQNIWDYGSDILGRNILEFEFNNNYIKVKFNGKDFPSKEVSLYQNFGVITFAVWGVNAIVYSVEMISRDTMEWDSVSK
ncbi:MAG: hypothetical protein WCT77_07725 [Bacteroidota bacterium]